MLRWFSGCIVVVVRVRCDLMLGKSKCQKISCQISVFILIKYWDVEWQNHYNGSAYGFAVSVRAWCESSGFASKDEPQVRNEVIKIERNEKILPVKKIFQFAILWLAPWSITLDTEQNP